MDIMKKLNDALVLSERHNDLELMNILSDLKTEWTEELNRQHQHSAFDQNNLVDIQWGHFTSNND